jgi:sRNA-binding protein
MTEKANIEAAETAAAGLQEAGAETGAAETVEAAAGGNEAASTETGAAETTAASRTQRAIRAVEWFRARFPAGQQNLPLEIGIFGRIIREYVRDFPSDPEPQKTCGHLLMRYTQNMRYQRALAAGGHRYTLDGEIAGEITPEQQQAAQQFIDKIKEAGEEKKRLKKERAAALRREKEEKAAKARAEAERRAAAKAAAKAEKAAAKAAAEAERRAAAERRSAREKTHGRAVRVVVKKRRMFSSS